MLLEKADGPQNPSDASSKHLVCYGKIKCLFMLDSSAGSSANCAFMLLQWYEGVSTSPSNLRNGRNIYENSKLRMYPCLRKEEGSFDILPLSSALAPAWIVEDPRAQLYYHITPPYCLVHQETRMCQRAWSNGIQ